MESVASRKSSTLRRIVHVDDKPFSRVEIPDIVPILATIIMVRALAGVELIKARATIDGVITRSSVHNVIATLRINDLPEVRHNITINIDKRCVDQVVR